MWREDTAFRIRFVPLVESPALEQSLFVDINIVTIPRQSSKSENIQCSTSPKPKNRVLKKKKDKINLPADKTSHTPLPKTIQPSSRSAKRTHGPRSTLLAQGHVLLCTNRGPRSPTIALETDKREEKMAL